MAVDKNLFLYDLAVVAIMKNEAPYVKEWLDYHLLAGVNHFYIYDHESTDNLKEILQPYINAGVVTYIFCPGEVVQISAYNEAVKKYKFFCRYMAFIDADEFILPQTNKSITEVTDEILADKPQAGGLGINWRHYGSNFQEKADYSKGVLARFTRCQKVPDKHVKTIANPRKIDSIYIPHFAQFFDNFFTLNESGNIFQGPFSEPPTANKIVINHYYTKSKEEYLQKVRRERVDTALKNLYAKFEEIDANYNEVVNVDALQYRNARNEKMRGTNLKVDYNKVYTALLQNLSPNFTKNAPKEFFQGKMETFLTCRKLIEHLRENLLEEEIAKTFEENALKAVNQTLYTNVSVADIKLLIAEMPQILPLKYSTVKTLRENLINLIRQLMAIYRVNTNYGDFMALDFALDMLNAFDA